MPQRQFGGVPVVEHDVNHALVLGVPGDRHYGHRDGIGLVVIHRNDAFSARLHEQAGIALEQFAIVAVNPGQEEVGPLPHAALDAGDDA